MQEREREGETFGLTAGQGGLLYINEVGCCDGYLS